MKHRKVQHRAFNDDQSRVLASRPSCRFPRCCSRHVRDHRVRVGAGQQLRISGHRCVQQRRELRHEPAGVHSRWPRYLRLAGAVPLRYSHAAPVGALSLAGTVPPLRDSAHTGQTAASAAVFSVVYNSHQFYFMGTNY